jgi:hypothetical protein
MALFFFDVMVQMIPDVDKLIVAPASSYSHGGAKVPNNMVQIHQKRFVLCLGHASIEHVLNLGQGFHITTACIGCFNQFNKKRHEIPLLSQLMKMFGWASTMPRYPVRDQLLLCFAQRNAQIADNRRRVLDQLGNRDGIDMLTKPT